MTLEIKMLDTLSSIIKKHVSDDLYIKITECVKLTLNNTPIHTVKNNPKHKNPPTAYSLFSKKTRHIYKNTDMTTTEIRADVRKKWESLEPSLKSEYIKEANKSLVPVIVKPRQKKKIVTKTEVNVVPVVVTIEPTVNIRDQIINDTYGFINYCRKKYPVNFPTEFDKISDLKTNWNNLSLNKKQKYMTT